MYTEQYRGPITNRGLIKALNIRDGSPCMGNLDFLGLRLSDLIGKKILDVGMGGGKTLDHALELGLNFFGLDILPLIDPTPLEPMKRTAVLTQRAEYERVRNKYPDRVQAVNFCSAEVPYSSDEFDIVLSAVALPDYARSSKEAIYSILNMIKLAREKVVFHCGWNPDIDFSGGVILGNLPVLFRFGMKDFLEDLKSTTGITYALHKSNLPDLNPLLTNLTIDTRQKDTVALQAMFEELTNH